MMASATEENPLKIKRRSICSSTSSADIVNSKKKKNVKYSNPKLSQMSIGRAHDESVGSVQNLVRQIQKAHDISTIDRMVSAHSNINTIIDLGKTWRGWIVLGETRPIALVTSDTFIKKEKDSNVPTLAELDRDILRKVVMASTSSKHTSVDPKILAIKNVKIKVKQYAMSDLEEYDSKFQQLSGISLFKGDKTGLRQVNKPGIDTYTEITSKYNLPDVYKEEGSQASSTELRIFKATVTLKKQPTCSLNERSRERLFLMFSPSDDNVLDIMNNSQIKNKMLRHEIGKYLKPQKKEIPKAKIKKVTNAPLYTKRNLPSLVPVIDLGALANLPPLTTEKLYDTFFKENVVEKEGYSILVKEQPLLVENITLCVLPTTMTEKVEVSQEGFIPRYSFNDREGEEISFSDMASQQASQLSRIRLKQLQAEKVSSLEPETIEPSLKGDVSNTIILESIVQNKLRETPELKDNMDIHLNQLAENLRLQSEMTTDILPIVRKKHSAGSARRHLIKLSKSKWNKFENEGDNARKVKQQVSKLYNELDKPVVDLHIPEHKPDLQSDEWATRGSLEQDISTVTMNTAYSGFSTSSRVTPGEPPLEDELENSENIRASVNKILHEIKENQVRLKKEVVIPVVKPELPNFLSTGKKRFYLNELQQYWSECHTDVTKFYHNPLEQSGHKCGRPVISDNRTKPQYNLTDDRTKSEDAISFISNITSREVDRPIQHISLPPIIKAADVDEIKHELATPVFTYAQNKDQFAGLTPSTFYKNSKKEIVVLSYCEKFLKNYYTRYDKRRKLFMCIENEYGVHKVVSTTIMPCGQPFKELDTWQTTAKFVANNVTFVPLENPLYLPHVLASPSLVMQRKRGNPFEMCTLLASLLIGQGYDAYVVSGYANILLTNVESSRNYLRYECPYLVSEQPSDPFQTFTTTSHVSKMIEKEHKPVKEVSSYRPTTAPYLDSSYIRQTKMDKEREKEEEAARAAIEDEENACSRYLSFFEADGLEGKRVHSWILVLPGNRGVESAFFLEPSSGLAYSPEDPHYYGIESLWNHQNYWIYLLYKPHCKKREPDEEEKEGADEKKESLKKPYVFDLGNAEIWLPLLINGPQIFKEKGKKKDAHVRLLKLQKTLDMPTAWCSRINITTNQVEKRINELSRTSIYKRALCNEYQVGFHDDGLVAKVTRFSDLPRTDPEYEVQLFERRKDLMFRRRREIVSDKLTEYFSFGREDCLKAHEFIDGADAMYCDHNIFFYWDFRDDGLKSVHMTDLFLKLDYGGRKDKMASILVLYGASIEQGKKGKRKGAEPEESGKTPRKEIQTIVQEFCASPDKTPWSDFAKITFRVNKGQTTVDYQYEQKRVTVTTKFIKKSHDDPELGQAVAEIAKRKRNKDDDDDNLSELDIENYDKELDISDDDISSSEEEAQSTSRTTNASLSEKKIKKGAKSKLSNISSNTKKSGKDKDQDSRKGKKSETGKRSSDEESTEKSTKSSVSEGSFALSDLECSSESGREQPNFYPAKIEADKDKSLWACSQKNKKIMARELSGAGVAKKNKVNDPSTDVSMSAREGHLTSKISEFGHLTKESSAESSDEEEAFIKEIRKRQYKAINETKEVYKAIERDEANPNISSLVGSGKSKKYQMCKLDQIVDSVNKVITDDKTIRRMKNKLDGNLQKKSLTFSNEVGSIKMGRSEQNIMFSSADKKSYEENDHSKRKMIESTDLPSQKNIKLSTPGENIVVGGDGFVRTTGTSLQLDASKMSKGKQQMRSSVEKFKKAKKKNEIDPLIIGIYGDSDRCFDDPFSMKKKRQASRGGAKLRNVFAVSATEDGSEENTPQDEESDTHSLTYKKEGEETISEEEAANEKDVDSVEGDIYNSDDNYSLESKNASSRECKSSEEFDDSADTKSENSFSCHSENTSVIEYQTEAPTHIPYNFQGFHFQAGKMYARKLYQLKEVCENAAIDSDQQSSYEGDEDYDAKFLEGEIDKFLDNTVDKISQEVREARHLIGGLKKGSETNLDQTGIYYCSLNDKYINYVDSYFKKINKKRELQSDKAFVMEMLKQRAKEPDKIIRHIREYVDCKKKGTEMKLDENLMNLIPHVRPVEVKKKDRLGYEILTDEDEEDNMTHQEVDDDEKTMKPETVIRESVEPVNVTMGELMNRLGNSPNAIHLSDAVSNLRKFKDMETVNQLIDLPLHECFSDVNIRNHVQNTKVNDGYFLDASIGGTVKKNDECHADLGFVTDPENILLSKDIESVVSSKSDSDVGEQDIKLKHMEVMTTCGKETIKEADFFDPIYKKKIRSDDSFRPEKFRMFIPLEPDMLDSDSDGSINNRIKEKRRKALRPKIIETVFSEVSQATFVTTTSDISTVTSNIQQRLCIDRTFGLEPIQAPTELCRVGVRNMSVNDEVSNVDKAGALENFLALEDDSISYIRNVEAYINNLLNLRRKERQSTKRNVLKMSRKGMRRANFKVLKQKLAEFNKQADDVSFDWDLLGPYLHLLLPQDGQKKFTYNTSNYIIRCLIIDFVERELFKLKGLYLTYENARQAVVAKKNWYMSELENMSFTEKHDYEKKVVEFNNALREISDKAHILRFVILRRAKQSTKKFLNLIKDIKNDDRINQAYSEAKERLTLIDLSKRWPEHFEFIHNFSGLPVASETNDFTTSYMSPVDDIIIRKILKQIRKKPAKYILCDKTYQRYVDLMERDREYFDGMKKKEVSIKKKRSVHSIFLGEKLEINVDGKNSDFIDKLEIVNDLEWADFFYISDSDDEEVVQGSMGQSSKISIDTLDGKQKPFVVCSKTLIEELILIKEVESSVRVSKESSSIKKSPSYVALDFDAEQEKKDLQFFEYACTPLARKHIQDKLPEYFEYI